MPDLIVRSALKKSGKDLLMSRLSLLARGVGMSALLALSTTPALAGPGKAERARIAIAEARGKVEAGVRIDDGAEEAALHDREKIEFANAPEKLPKGKTGKVVIELQHAMVFA